MKCIKIYRLTNKNKKKYFFLTRKEVKMEEKKLYSIPEKRDKKKKEYAVTFAIVLPS